MTNHSVIPLGDNGNTEVRVRIRRRPAELIAVAPPELTETEPVKIGTFKERCAEKA
jgi:hypothetical protein